MSLELKDRIEQKDKEIVRALKYRIKDRARKELSGLEFKIYEAIWSRCGEERFTEAIKSKTRNKILDLQKKRQNGEISQDELVGSLLDLKYLDL